MKTLIVNTTRRTDCIAWGNLVRIEASSNYSKIYMADGKILFAAKVLKKLEAELDREHFVRIHKTHLVNKEYIKSYITGHHPSLVLSNGEIIPVSRSHKSKMRWLQLCA